MIHRQLATFLIVSLKCHEDANSSQQSNMHHIAPQLNWPIIDAVEGRYSERGWSCADKTTTLASSC